MKRSFLTVDEVQELLRFTDRQAVLFLIRNGKLPAVKMGIRFLIDEEDVDALIERRRYKPKNASADVDEAC